jgi:hypothetical protein
MKTPKSDIEKQMEELIEEASDIVSSSYLTTDEARRIINLLSRGLSKIEELRISRDNWRNKYEKLNRFGVKK